MASLSYAQLVSLAQQAGFSNASASTIAAIALAESSGNPVAHNARRPDNSYGLTQINMIDALGPQRRAQLGLRANEDLFDPLTNFRAAYVISRGGQDFSPWTTYTKGSYKRYLSASGGSGLPIPPIPFVPGGDYLGEAFGGATDAIGGAIAAAFGAAVAPFVEGLRRLSIIGLAVGGGVTLVVLGAWRGVKAS